MIVQYANGRRATVVDAIISDAVPGIVNYYRVTNANGRKSWWNAANVRLVG